LLISRVVLRVPFGPINNIAQTFAHPQAKARGITVEVDVSLRSIVVLVVTPLLAPPRW